MNVKETDNEFQKVSNNDTGTIVDKETNITISPVQSSNKTSLIILIIVLSLGLIALIISLCVVYIGRKKGDLLEVSTISTVGFNLDDISTEIKDTVIDNINKLDDEVWINRVNRQLSFTWNRLTFRSGFYENTKSLFLPSSEHFQISFLNSPQKAIIDGHEIIYRNYTLKTYILGKINTAEESDAKLKDIGGYVIEEFILPIDPTLLIQNTDFACMNEDQFPVGSVDPESADYYYDDSCQAGKTPEGTGYCSGDEFGCHCSKGSDLSCVEAIKDKIGSVKLELKFEKIKFDFSLANDIEEKNIYLPNKKLKGADLVPVKEGLENNYSVYKYIDCLKSCEKNECLNGKCGWRKLILFDTTDVNVGKENVFVGNISYTYNVNEFDEKEYHNMFYYDICHKHAHYAGYVEFDYNGTTGGKLGFCMQDTNRIINHRDVSVHSTFDSCKTQGMSPGFGDTYNRGLPCQWFDVTEFSKQMTNIDFTQVANPKTWMCEGKMKLKDGKPVFIDTGEKTDFKYKEQGNPIYKYDCEDDENVVHGNNRETVNFKLTPHGEAMLTSSCMHRYYTIGPKRDCEFFNYKNFEICDKGIKKKLICLNSGNKPVVVRICEASSVLNSGVACRYNDDSLLKNVVISAFSQSNIEFDCPKERDTFGEIGGAYSIYIGDVFNTGTVSSDNFNFICK
jgi:hypothetical protein